MIRFRGLPAAAAALALLSACTAAAEPSGNQPETPSPFAACDTLTAPPAPATSATSAAAPATSAAAPAATPATSAAVPAAAFSAAPLPATPASVVSSAAATRASAATPAFAEAIVASSGATTPVSDAATPSAATGPGGAAINDLPDLSIPCFTGGQPVSLHDIALPAVLNIWASWCGPCREELPVMQGLADRTAGRLTVVGVDSSDRREAAASFGTDKGVSMPVLYDRDGRLAIEIKQSALPATVFVDADGGVYVHRRPLTVDELITEVEEHTGVTVTR
ncbi:TlpA disulfide reductase family protein [Actinoplanes sp. DH11]|uniref:TlpA family protein disulfide reductase n=1 Tax=Actinoplanes sp. DH11 TaxID=2857011 RepID=UPI001E520F3E|nr:TlpA disulfide reductase family protein [Actinoplanes sp. DH11]